MRTQFGLVRKSLTPIFVWLAWCAFAAISGNLLLESRSLAEPSDPRPGTDSRPSEPPSAGNTPASSAAGSATNPAAKPGGTAVKAAPKLPLAKPFPASKTAVAKPTPVPTSLETSRKFPKVVTKLMVDDLQNGRGRASKPGARLAVHFQSWLYDPTQPLGRGPQFESTHGKAPYKFTLQNPDTPHIRGWEEGLLEMKPGGKRRLIIPPELAYGANGAGQVVPPGATLLYEIELVDVE